MTYLESYRKLDSWDEIKKEVLKDINIVLLFGGSNDRIKAIQEAMNGVLREKGITPTTEELNLNIDKS